VANRLAVLVLVVLALTGCTGNGGGGGSASPTPSATSSASPSAEPTGPLPTEAVAAVCRDLDRIDRRATPVLERLRAGTETVEQFPDDALEVSLLASDLYQDASAFAATHPTLFATFNQLSGQLFDVVTGEDLLTDPADVVPSTVPVAQEGIAQVDQAVADGLLPCPTS
jgi:hypothetical protein